MKTILYIPGFQENKTSKPVGPVISNYCENNEIDFHTIDVPGDTNSNPDTELEFSLTALKEVIRNKIVTILESNSEDLTTIAYSLSARPTIDAISKLSDGYKSRINLKLIHPAVNPLETVQRMELIRRGGRGKMISKTDLVSGNPKFFEKLILNWKGNSTEFGKNLDENFSDLSFDGLEDKIREKLGINDITVFSSGNDMITGEKKSGNEKWTQILRSHFPEEELLRKLLSSL